MPLAEKGASTREPKQPLTTSTLAKLIGSNVVKMVNVLRSKCRIRFHRQCRVCYWYMMHRATERCMIESCIAEQKKQ